VRHLLAAAVVLLSASDLFASADLAITRVTLPDTTVRAGELSPVEFKVTNRGPDFATGVVYTITASDGPERCGNGCSLPGLKPGDSEGIGVLHLFPSVPGPVTVIASVSSPSDISGTHSAFVTVTVSPDPDVALALSAPIVTDLALPFSITILLANSSAIAAHDVDVTVDFRPDVDVPPSLPSGCSNPAAGRIVCHLDTLVGTPMDTYPNGTYLNPVFVVPLIGPPAYDTGYVNFTASVSEREHNYDALLIKANANTDLYRTIYVTTTADDGAGSLRQAILEANRATGPSVTLAFRIDEPSPTPWKTIHVTSPLPPVTAAFVRIEGATQTGFFGDTNPDGPEIEISGGGTIDGDGLVITKCFGEVANLAIGGFRGNGLSVTASALPICDQSYPTELHHLFLGTDPTGTTARPNGRGIGTSDRNGTDFNSALAATNIHDCVISGNVHSGIFALSGRASIWSNRIGVKAHRDDPLPNGGSGIYIGAGSYGSAIGPEPTTLADNLAGNVIAFNGQIGVAVDAAVNDVSIRGNRIWNNGALGIDVGLDGPGESGSVTAPVLTLAHYDPASNKTILEGDTAGPPATGASFTVDLYANDAADSSGFGEGQRPIGSTQTISTTTHFRFTADGDLTGQFITATTTLSHYTSFAKPQGITNGDLTQTSEFSRAIEVR